MKTKAEIGEFIDLQMLLLQFADNEFLQDGLTGGCAALKVFYDNYSNEQEVINLLEMHTQKLNTTKDEHEKNMYLGSCAALMWILGRKEFPSNIAERYAQVKAEVQDVISRN